MINLRNSPFLWISLMLLATFWINMKSPQLIQPWFVAPMFCVSIACAISASLPFNPKFQYLSSLFIGMLIFFSGTIRIHQFNKDLYGEMLMDESQNRQGIFKVNQVLKNKGSSISLKCERLVIFENDESNHPFGDKYLLIYIRSPDELHFLPGDMIRAEGWISAIAAPLNPDAFDAGKYYNTIGIRHQMYCKGEDVSITSLARFSIARMTAMWQATLSALVRSHISPQVAQLTNALVWGDRSDMDSEVRDAFADSGAMHVLSVSGMHVAIIYSMLVIILGTPGAGPFIHRLIRFGCYAFAIILYMGLTGACPAVVRAGLMIILYLLGKSMGWNTQVWNLLGFAAFIMLWINPFVWENIGFQLSFLAMAGILLFAKPIIRFLSFKKKVLHMCWEITALSIAAQVFILPILLSQFHQFPLTFILSSIAAIPAAYLVMSGALLNIILSFLGIDFLWPALDWTGKIFINTMQWMSALNPLMHFSMPTFGSFFLMMMAVIFSISLVFKWPPGRKIAWGLAIAAMITLGCNRVQQWSSSDLVLYYSTTGLLIDIFEQGHCYSILDCSLTPASVEFATRGYRCRKDIINVRNICKEEEFDKSGIHLRNSTLNVSKHSIIFWNERYQAMTDSFPTHLVIEECVDVKCLTEYILNHKHLNIILPAHLDRNRRKELKMLFDENNIEFYDIAERGYLKIEL